MKSRQQSIVILLAILMPFIGLAQKKSAVSGSLNISGLFDTAKPVILVEYEPQSTAQKILFVDVLITITDNSGLNKIIIGDEVVTLTGKRKYQKVIKTPNLFDLNIRAVDVNSNEATSITNVAVTSTYKVTLIARKKLALVVGNSNYQHSAPLKNPKNDAVAMSSTLEELGFQVITALDATKNEMMNALKEFSARLQGMEVAFFYYAGHGMQVRGKNYLIPVDAQFKNGESDVEFESVNVEMLTKIMNNYLDSKDRLNLLVLDACRNNPYRTWSRGGDAGLASMTAPSGTLVAFSTAPGSVSSDGTGSNGLYTGELIKQLKISQRIEDVFINTRNAVEAKSNGRQSPWELARLKGQYFLK